MNDGYVICPFFRSQSNQRIWCEGVIRGAKIAIDFDKKDLKRIHMRKYCRSFDYVTCPYASVILKEEGK